MSPQREGLSVVPVTWQKLRGHGTCSAGPNPRLAEPQILSDTSHSQRQHAFSESMPNKWLSLFSMSISNSGFESAGGFYLRSSFFKSTVGMATFWELEISVWKIHFTFHTNNIDIRNRTVSRWYFWEEETVLKAPGPTMLRLNFWSKKWVNVDLPNIMRSSVKGLVLSSVHYILLWFHQGHLSTYLLTESLPRNDTLTTWPVGYWGSHCWLA